MILLDSTGKYLGRKSIAKHFLDGGTTTPPDYINNFCPTGRPKEGICGEILGKTVPRIRADTIENPNEG
jgi:hypothetical protein